MKKSSTYPIAVDPSLKLKFQGLILDLDEFNGPVNIMNNTFQ